MDYKIVYKYDGTRYSVISLIDGTKSEISELGRHADTIYINNDFNRTVHEYTVLMKLGNKKVLCINKQGEIQIIGISKLNSDEVSNRIMDVDLGISAKLLVKCNNGHIIRLPSTMNNLYLAALLIQLYNSTYVIDSNDKYNGKFLSSTCANTHMISKDSCYYAIHCIGNLVFTTRYSLDSLNISNDIRELASRFVVLVNKSRIYPISRVITDNVYYNVIDNTLPMHMSIKNRMIKMSLQELAKNFGKTEGVVVLDGVIRVTGLDGYYEYTIEDVNKTFNVELINDTRTNSRRLLGLETDDITLTNKGELQRIQTKANTIHVPIECKTILKDSICISRNVRCVNIPNSVTEIKRGSLRFIGSNIRDTLNIVVDNNSKLELLNLFKEVNKNYDIHITVKHKVVGYNEIEFIMQCKNGKVEFEEKLSEKEIKAFLKELSIKKFNSFKGLEDAEKLYELNSNWVSYSGIHGLYGISDKRASEFVIQYVDYIEKRLKYAYEEYKNIIY